MRFLYGAVPDNVDFHPEAEGWRDIREPDPVMLQVYALPVVIVIILLWAVLVFAVAKINPFNLNALEGTGSAAFWFAGLGLFLLIIPLHELLHALVHPGWGLSSDTILGLWLSKGVFYAHYQGSMPRNRFLLVLLLPYLALGVLPVLGMGLFPGLSRTFLIFSFWGSVLACGDIVGVGLVLFQIPHASVVRNKGWKTFWKPASG